MWLVTKHHIVPCALPTALLQLVVPRQLSWIISERGGFCSTTQQLKLCSLLVAGYAVLVQCVCQPNWAVVHLHRNSCRLAGACWVDYGQASLRHSIQALCLGHHCHTQWQQTSLLALKRWLNVGCCGGINTATWNCAAVPLWVGYGRVSHTRMCLCCVGVANGVQSLLRSTYILACTHEESTGLISGVLICPERLFAAQLINAAIALPGL